MLKIDFYESGKGETTVITFPDESIGIIDAFPSDCNSRQDILSITDGKKINFICLSHPHDDHARDLSSIIRERNPEAFWNTIQVTAAWFYGITESNKYKSSISYHIEQRKQKAVESLINLFFEAKNKKIIQRKISSSTKPMNIAGVDIFFLAPDDWTISQYEYLLTSWTSKESSSPPDHNIISSVIAFKYGDHVFLHGGDALAKQWINVCQEFDENKLPLSVLVKIPHHGAKNTLFLGKYDFKFRKDYIKLFKENARLVIFGNSTHPNLEVWEKLRNKSNNIFFLQNRYRPHPDENPLNIPGGRLKNSSIGEITCNSIIHVEMDEHGGIVVNPGTSCECCGIKNSCIPEKSISIHP